MADFPENQIEILPDFLSDDLNELWEEMRTALTAAEITINGRIAEPNAVLVNQILSARRRLLSFLNHAAKLTVWGTFGRQFRDREFRAALQTFQSNSELVTVPFVHDFGGALRTTPILFREIVSDPGFPEFSIERTLHGYSGPILNPAQRTQFLAWSKFLSEKTEQRFRLGLLQAEANAALGKFEESNQLYLELLNATQPFDSPRHKFVAIRAAFAHIGLGDTLFRKSRNPDEAKRIKILEEYRAAIQLVQITDISPNNPRRKQVEQYVTVQLGKLNAGLNVIGYRDNYVPVIKPPFLQALAEASIERAKEAIAKFELFKSKANEIQEQLNELEFDVEIKDLNNGIANERVANANAQKRVADKRIEQIQSQLDALNDDLFKDLSGQLLVGVGAVAAGVATGGAGAALVVAGAVGGATSTITGYSSRKDDLHMQKEIATIESGIAARDVEIAMLEQQIVAQTLDFLGEKILRIQNGELNAELYFAAGETFRTLAELHLGAANYYAYLFERAVAFLRLEPDLQIIRFDYLPLTQPEQPGNPLTAANKLEADLAQVIDKNVPITKFQLLPETYSLRSFYPLEFSRFLQTGDMDFTMSLYEMNKRRPGVFRQRIKHVDVQVVGSIPITGYTGRIIHRGSFLLRDKDTTPEPADGSFVPTDQELSETFENLNNGATQGVSIGGVIPLLVNEDTIELSPDMPPPDLTNPLPEALLPIEGYGPAGDWRLEIENIDLRLITDVLLKINYVIPESDADLSRRVKGLIANYEQELTSGDQLDLITPFSLRHKFPDALNQLSGGQTNLEFGRNEFPSGITDLKLKTVVAQALDDQQKGIEGLAIEIVGPSPSLNLAQSTHSDGFTEDVTVEIPFLPPSNRFPVEGTYTLRLPDPSQAAQLADLILFFVYEFKEI